MAHEGALSALIDLPAGHAQQALRAGLMAMNVVPDPMPAGNRARIAALTTMVNQPNVVAFVDISQNAPSILDLDKQLPAGGWRQRVFLTRLSTGHVSEGDRRWALKLGFGDLWSDFDANDVRGDLQDAIQATAFALDRKPLVTSELRRYTTSAGGNATNQARAALRRITGLKAESLMVLLAKKLSIKERSFHLQTYPSCFVGAEAVAIVSKHFNCSADEAVLVGSALESLGLLVHVLHERPFLDGTYFYRLATSTRADQINLGEALHVLRRQGGVDVAERMHLGRDYPTCWVGSEAVDFLVGHFDLKRHQAWVLGHRLMQFGVFEHVVKERPFIDGNFFYRFADDAAKLKVANAQLGDTISLPMVQKLA